MTIKINENERKVLSTLNEGYDSCGSACYYFRGIVADTKLDLRAVRRACRSLRKKGLASFERGLFNEDGAVAGSGYSITDAGAAFMLPCDVCATRATYDYEVDESGARTPLDYLDGRRILECDDHYKQSPGLAPTLPLENSQA